ncbi:MAG: NADH-quinone oxidoreductase subunit, partial [Rhodoferax sp.]|nr:NADH-quinone oxidoreductase subunit [Rhodoferax sp.]
NSDERLTQPMLKQGGEWRRVDWQTALEYVANGLRQIKADHGAQSIGTLASAHSTLEELFLAGALMRGLGSENIDYRLRNADFSGTTGQVRWLGTSIASLSQLQQVLVIGSNLRKDHPLFAQRIRQAARRGCKVHAVNEQAYDWAMPIASQLLGEASGWAQALGEVAIAIASAKEIAAPVPGEAGDVAKAMAKALLSGSRKAILLGNAAAHHGHAAHLLALANWIGTETGASVGFLTEAANTVGAQVANAMPGKGGLNAAEMMDGGLKAVLLLNNEPEFDAAQGARALAGLNKAQMVVTLSPFKANLQISDVLLPIAPFTETSGTFVNAEGRLQSFHAVVKPQGEARPAWKVLRVLANMLGLPGFDDEASTDVLARGLPALSGLGQLPADMLSNASTASLTAATQVGAPAVATIYQLDGIVRRATALQLTADGRLANKALEQEVAA